MTACKEPDPLATDPDDTGVGVAEVLAVVDTIEVGVDPTIDPEGVGVDPPTIDPEEVGVAEGTVAEPVDDPERGVEMVPKVVIELGVEDVAVVQQVVLVQPPSV